MNETILRLNYIAGTIAILMIPLLFIGAIVWRIQLRIERYEEAYNAIKKNRQHRKPAKSKQTSCTDKI